MTRKISTLGRGGPGLVVLGTLVVLLFAGCGGPFSQSALEPRSDVAELLDSLFRAIFWWAVGVFVIVEGALIFVVLRFRARPGGPPPRQTHGHTALEIGWTLAPAIVLIFIAIPTIRAIWIVDRPPEGDAMVVEAIGHQWWWEFRYPEYGLVTANELHLPVDRTVDVRLTSADVIHSFWFPRMGGKRDVVPGHQNSLWFTPDSVGTYTGQCAEFCGLSHAFMKMELVVEEQADFDAWLAANVADAVVVDAVVPDSIRLAEGGQAFLQSGCAACHSVRGTPAAGVLGPDLTHVGSRRKIASGIMDNTPENMARWLENPPAVKPGALMPQLSLDQATIDAIVFYLQNLD